MDDLDIVEDKQGEVLSMSTKKDHFGHCFEITQIGNGDKIPVGGDNFLSSEANTYLRCDFESFNQLIQEMHDRVDQYDLTAVKQWLDEAGIDIDPKLFIQLYVFTQKLEEEYPNMTENYSTRGKDFYDSDEPPKLSVLFSNDAVACAEISALSQFYMQGEGINATYFGGEVLKKKTEYNYPSPHSFNIIRIGGRTLLYDPARPVKIEFKNGGKDLMPSVYVTTQDFDAEISQGKKRLVTFKNLFSEKEEYFGVGNLAEVLAGQIV